MRKALRIIAAVVMTAISGSCTHNNGDIGPWFGEWKLTSIEIDGTPDAAYKGNIFWAFQTSVIEMIQVEPVTPDVSDYGQRWGTWSQEENTLTLNFTHHDDNAAEGSGKYTPYPATHLPGGVSKLGIIKLSGSEIKLSYTANDGKTYTYSLKKWG